MQGRDLLIYLSIKYSGDFNKMFDAIKKREVTNEAEVAKALEKIGKDTKVVTIIDAEYPDILKQVYMPPLVLYCKGDISLLNAEGKLGITGSRDPSKYGIDMTTKLVKGIADGLVVVSGGARGIDTVAHQTCLENEGKTIAILGSGIDYVYPQSNEKLFKEITEKGLLISEYPGMTNPTPDSFPYRNRIVAGLSNKVLVTEAQKNSGTNITVLHALKQGKDVMAVPHEADHESSCNLLIQDGALLVDSVKDLKVLTDYEKYKNRFIEKDFSKSEIGG